LFQESKQRTSKFLSKDITHTLFQIIEMAKNSHAL